MDGRKDAVLMGRRTI